MRKIKSGDVALGVRSKKIYPEKWIKSKEVRRSYHKDFIFNDTFKF